MPGEMLIVGGGFSGVALLCRLKHVLPDDQKITLYESEESVGLGLAYATQNPEHLLNVPANNMSLYHDVPNHFTSWLAANFPGVRGTEFVSRKIYGAYLQSELSATLKRFPNSIEIRNEQVSSILPHKEGFIVNGVENHLRSACQVFVCTGHRLLDSKGIFEPIGDCKAFVANPYTLNTDEMESRDIGRILIAGTGLTMVDAFLTLVKKYPKSLFDCVSRTGLPPRRHALASEVKDAPDYAFNDLVGAPLIKVLRSVHSALKSSRELQIPWQQVIDQLRPFTQDIWLSLSPKDKLTFLKRLRSRWDNARHRIADSIHDQLKSAIDNGQMRIIKSRSMTFKECDRLQIEARFAEYPREPQKYDLVVNCIGAEFSPVTAIPPVLMESWERGLIKLDPLGMGIHSTRLGEVLFETHAPGLFLLGPLMRSQLWEITAVPEIRKQIFEISNVVAARH